MFYKNGVIPDGNVEQNEVDFVDIMLRLSIIGTVECLSQPGRQESEQGMVRPRARASSSPITFVIREVRRIGFYLRREEFQLHEYNKDELFQNPPQKRYVVVSRGAAESPHT